MSDVRRQMTEIGVGFQVFRLRCTQLRRTSRYRMSEVGCRQTDQTFDSAQGHRADGL